MKICILTHSLHYNYGGLLQAYALQKTLKDMGHDVVTAKDKAEPITTIYSKLIRFPYHFIMRYIRGNKAYNPFKYMFTRFDKFPKILNEVSVNTSRFTASNIRTVNFFNGRIHPSKSELKKYDAIVVGSDQIWRPCYVYVPAYFLDFTKDIKVKRVAYAGSFGLDSLVDFTPKMIKKCKDAAQLFDAISVREDSAIELCKNNFGIEPTHVLDPTMLLGKKDYIDIIKDEDKSELHNVIMCYILDKSSEKNMIVKYIAEKLKLTELHVMPKVVYPEPTDDTQNWAYPSVSKWLSGFRDAEFVVTDSFHGTVFSLIFNKPFICIDNSQRGSSRFTSLLRIFDLEYRMVSSLNDVTDDLLKPMDYTRINDTITTWKQKSLDFLSILQ